MPRQPSRPDSEGSVVALRLDGLERDRDKLEAALPRLEGKLTGLELALARVTEKVEQGNARTSTETVKIIMAGVVTVALAVVGSRAAAPDQKAPVVEVHKSEAEVESEVCKKLASDQERSICLTGVLNRLIKPQKR